ncbi:DUF2975 domain-containing protein [Metaclostridioides mangenotii]|uniref:DUF2975 domain-containing protein n=1 Tax=Metaclostridioides mangenotii TaxID=1540 RepID=UPI000484C245|nr:DUF2975 domain-containing protein [Clostridioides mangenotii]
MRIEKIKSLLVSFLWLSLIIMVIALIVGSIIFVIDLICGKITLKIFFDRFFIAIVLLGYSIIMYVLLRISKTLKESSPFIRANIKRFNGMGLIFFIEAVVQAIYSSIFTPNEGIAQILGLNITIELVTLAIFSITFFLIADVFDKAVKIKEDNDLTI